MRRSISSGFSLIELVVAVAVVAILARIAYPAYLDSVRKSRRADAKSVLLQASQWMERFYTENNRYDQNLETTPKYIATLSSGAPIIPTTGVYGGPTQSPTQGTKAYDIVFATLNTDGTINNTYSRVQNSYVLRAVPASGNDQAKDQCGTLTLTSTGVKDVQNASSGFDAVRCW